MTVNQNCNARGDNITAEDDEEVNMDELWKKLRAANDAKSKTSTKKTAPSMQVKKPEDPSPN